jgi:hypothetical protein
MTPLFGLLGAQSFSLIAYGNHTRFLSVCTVAVAAFGRDISRVATCVIGRVRRRGIFIVFNAFPLHFSLTSCVPLAFPSLSVSVSVSRSLARSLPLYLPPSPLSLSVCVYLSTMCQYVSSNTLSLSHTHTTCQLPRYTCTL